jgi:hypothetical protein
MRDFCKSMLWSALLVPALLGVAAAQTTPTQTIYFSSSGTNNQGWTYCYCCYCSPQYRTPQSIGDGLTLGPFPDLIGYAYVRVTVECRWGIDQAGGTTYTIHMNGTGTQNEIGPVPASGTSNSCQAPGSASSTTYPSLGGAAEYSIDLQPTNTIYNVGGNNSIRFVNTSGNFCRGLTDGPANGGPSTWMVKITITGLNQPPQTPTNLGQIGPDGKGIGVGGTCFGADITLRATVDDPDADDCYLEAEIVAPTVFFSNSPNFTGNPAPSGNFGQVVAQGLPEGPYHWQVRAGDEFDFLSPWVSFGSNSEIVPDVIMSNAVVSAKPIDSVNHGGGDCNISAGFAGGLLSPALLGLALLAFGMARKK